MIRKRMFLYSSSAGAGRINLGLVMIIPNYSCLFLIFLDYFFQSVKMMKVKNQSSATWKFFGGIVGFLFLFGSFNAVFL